MSMSNSHISTQSLLLVLYVLRCKPANSCFTFFVSLFLMKIFIILHRFTFLFIVIAEHDKSAARISGGARGEFGAGRHQLQQNVARQTERAAVCAW